MGCCDGPDRPWLLSKDDGKGGLLQVLDQQSLYKSAALLECSVVTPNTPVRHKQHHEQRNASETHQKRNEVSALDARTCTRDSMARRTSIKGSLETSDR